MHQGCDGLSCARFRGRRMSRARTQRPARTKGEKTMNIRAHRNTCVLAAVLAAATALAQETPYREDGWAKLPDGRKWGATSAIDVDRDGNIWVFERCGGGGCAPPHGPPICPPPPTGPYTTHFSPRTFRPPTAPPAHANGA